MRLIDADALDKNIKEIYCKGCNSYNGVRCRACWVDDASIAIDSAPTIEAEPVRHGKWKRCFEDWRHQIEGDECSACGFQHYGSAIDHYHYCPNCGAKMDLEEEA